MTTNSSLTLVTLDQSGHMKTCGYWYLVQNNCMAHTAFKTRAGLFQYLLERGLELSVALPAHGAHSYQRIKGSYRENMCFGGNAVAAFNNLQGAFETRTLSNGDYVEAKITKDADGIRTVHTLNPNEIRHEFNYQESDALIS